MRNELERQQKLKELLQYHYSNIDSNIKVYSNNDFKRIDGEWNNRPDLIILNAPGNTFKFKTKNNIVSPIGIELKDTTQFNDITTGIMQSTNYLDYTYEIRETGLEVKLKTMVFTTTNSIKKGIIGKKFEDNKSIERFAWNLGLPILITHENNLCWSFRNKYFDLKGKIYGRFEQHAKFYKY